MVGSFNFYKKSSKNKENLKEIVMKKIISSLVILLVFMSSCSNNSSSDSCGAKSFYSDYWDWAMKTYPTWASSKGYGERHNTFFENTEENIEKVNKEKKEFLKKVNSLILKKSCDSENMNLSLLKNSLETEVEGMEFENFYIQFESMGGVHTWMPQLHNRVPLNSLQNYKDYLERMAKIPDVFRQSKEMSIKGLKKGFTPPKVTFKNYESSMFDLSQGEAEENPFYTPFKEISDKISESQKESLREEAKRVIVEKIQPAYKDLYEFWTKEYYPNLRTSIAVSALPKGEAYYNYRIKEMTTLDKTAKEIHEIGMSEVNRILKEMEQIKKKVEFKGSLKNFFKELRANKKFYAKTKEELMSKAAVILKTIDGKLPRLFKVLPMTPYGLEPIPDYIAHKSPAAYYIHGDMKIKKSGTYQLNLSNLESRPLYNLVALSLHEAVPGHHLQIAIAQELNDLPEFRKEIGPTAFIEGWGLYSESLGKMVGMYDDPYDDFGRLTYEQWRAMRLVVDTGIHAFGWSRDKAIDFMKSNSGLSEKNIINEVDRYINWPGQALAYKMGELKIKELRALSEKELGSEYDIRDFHDVVLREGAIPLPVLESNVKKYIAKTKKKSS